MTAEHANTIPVLRLSPARSAAAAAAPSRRGFLAAGALSGLAAAAVGTAAVAFPAIGAAASAGVGADAEIVKLAAVMGVHQAAIEAMGNDPIHESGPHSQQEYDDYENRIEAALDGFWDAYDKLEGLRATTTAGIRAKAEAMRLILLQCTCTMIGETLADIGSKEPQERMAWSLARDVLATFPAPAGPTLKAGAAS